MNCEYVIIGAGFAALAAGRGLQDIGVDDFIILEEGKSNEQRSCPGVSSSTCVNCQDGCRITCGIGGANALHGNKLCYFPASDGVATGCTSEELDDAITSVNGWLSPLARFRAPEITAETFGRKSYFSDALSLPHFRDLVANLSKPLRESGKIKTGTRVHAISRRPEMGFDISTNVGHFRSEKILWATGRRGASLSTELYANLGVAFQYPQPDFGVRIQSNIRKFSKAYYYQTDPKFKFAFEDGVSARTFCAHNRGMVVPVLIGRGFYADGAFAADFGENNNIALMIRDRARYSTSFVDAWCSEINRAAGRGLRHSTITTPFPGRGGLRRLQESLIECAAILPSVSLQRHWPTFIRELVSGSASIFSLEGNELPIDVFAPAVDRYWPEPYVDINLETTCRSFFVAGDAAGKSRGFFQAMIGGYLWANRQKGQFTSKCKCYNSALLVSH